MARENQGLQIALIIFFQILVEFGSHAEAQKAIKSENGKDFDGRILKVTLSSQKPGPPGF